jgi:ADP-ribose pyrophosphatase
MTEVNIAELEKKILAIYDEFRTINKTKEEGNKFLSIERYTFELNNGKKISREKILKGKSDGSAAIVLPITNENKVVLAIEPRVFTELSVDIGLPAGYIEKGEIPIFAAVRELKEETGYEPRRVQFLGSYYQDQGCSEAQNYYYIAYGCKKVGEQNLDEGEFIKYIEVSLAELDYLLNNGYIKGLNSAYTIEKSKALLKELKNNGNKEGN